VAVERQTRYWLALGRVKRLDLFVLPGLIERFGSAEGIFRETRAALEAFSAVLAREIRRFDEWAWVDAEIERAARYGASIITYSDPAYPASLKEIHDPPCVLYAIGASGFCSEQAAVAVVGTRRPTHYGLRMAGSIARDLASAGVAVVSGMARGCDTAAHRGALKGGERGDEDGGQVPTIAVLGTGVDVAYPRENARLHAEIMDKGLVVSEFAMSTPPMQYNFPRRNRIISGLSMGVVVAEAPLKSGALMTAEFSLDYGREVFAVPGRADSARGAGTNRLIRDGAALVESADDVLRALGCRPVPQSGTDADNGRPALEGDERLLYETLSDETMQIDGITERTGLSSTRALGLLLEMELKGYVEQLPGKSFARKF